MCKYVPKRSLPNSSSLSTFAICFILIITFVVQIEELIAEQREVIAPKGYPKYLCDIRDTGYSITINLRLKKKGKIQGKKSWNAKSIDSQIKKLTKATLRNKNLTAKYKPIIKQLKKLKIPIDRCYTQYNDSKGSPFPPVAPTPIVQKVLDIIEQNCMGCHTAQGWTNSEEFYLSTQRVVPKNLEASTLYTYLKGNPEGYSPASMPKGLSALSQEEILVISEWINSLPIEEAKPVSFTCDNSKEPSPSPLMRLSNQEYRNSIIEILKPLSVNSSDYNAVWSSVNAQLNLVPQDHVSVEFLHEPEFSRLDNSLTQPLIDAWYRVASEVALQVNQSSSRRAAFAQVGCDPGSTGASTSCLTSWITKFGLKAFRRPLSQAEVASYLTYFQNRPRQSAVADTILTLLLSPQFLFHFEREGTPINGNSKLLQLTPYELLSKLTYTFWHSMPSEELFAAVSNGVLNSEEGYNSIVNTIITDTVMKRTRSAIDNFWSEHLHLDLLPPVNAGNTPAFNSFATGLNILPSDAELAFAMQDDLLKLIEYYTWDTPGRFEDLLTSNLSFVQSSKLANIYGVPPWAGPGNPPLELPESRGIFQRAGFLVSGTEQSLPIKRGGRVLREWMCVNVPPPDPSIADGVKPPPPDPTLSTRDRFHHLTKNQPCSTCHAKINPFGFVFEMYDSIGRKRADEMVFDAMGKLIASHAVNTDVELEIRAGNKETLNSPHTLIEKAIDTGMPQACLSQQAFRYFRRKRENIINDGCALETMRSALTKEGGSILEMFKAIALSPDFKMTKINQ